MFNIRASYADEAEAIVNQIVALGLKNIAVFYQNDGFGKSGLDGVTNALKRANLAPIAVGTVERNSLDVAKAVESISKTTPQAVVMVTLYKPTAAFVKAMKQIGQFPMFLTLSPVGGEVLARNWVMTHAASASRRSCPTRGTTPSASSASTRSCSTSRRTSSPTTAWRLSPPPGREALKKTGKDLTREKLVSTIEACRTSIWAASR
jgi:hypothetical protein